MFPKAQMRENSVISGFKGTSHYLTSLPQTKNIARVLWLFMVNAMLSQAHEVTVTSRWDWCEQATRCWSPALRSQCFSQSSQNTELLKRVSLLSQLFLVMDQISSPKMQSASEWYIQKFNQDVGNSIFDSFSNQKKKSASFFFLTSSYYSVKLCVPVQCFPCHKTNTGIKNSGWSSVLGSHVINYSKCHGTHYVLALPGTGNTVRNTGT